MRSAQSQANQAFNTSKGTASSAENNAAQIHSTLVPTLEREIQNPTGYTPEELNNMRVASEQGAGGAESGLVGSAAARMARTRNSSGYSALADEAARDKMRTLSQNNLNIEGENARLAQQKRAQAEGQLGNILGTDVRETLGAQGLLPEDVNAEVNAGKSGWFQNMTNLIASLGGAAGGAASARNAFK
jgi:hypothetical protein